MKRNLILLRNFAFCLILIICLFSQKVSADTPLSQCTNITVSGEYSLANNVASSVTCMNITASNVTLDCQGNTILYATTGTTSRYGIDMRNTVNVTVKNCIIMKPSALGTNGYGIYALQTNNSFFDNNTIMTNGTSSNTGIYLDTGGRNNIMSHNTILTKGTSSGNYGIYINTGGTVQSQATTIESNLISTNVNNASASDGTYSIHVNEDYTIIRNNILNIMGATGASGNRGINLPATSINTRINNNTINLYMGGGTSAGIYITTSGHNVTNNTIVSFNPTSIGIMISGTGGTYLSGNQLNVSSGGIYIASNTISDFTATTILSDNLVYGKPVMYYGGAGASPVCPNNTIMDNPNYGAIGFIKCNNITLKNFNPDGTADPLLIIQSTRINISNATIYRKHIGVRYTTTLNNLNTLENSNISTYGYSDAYGINLYGIANTTVNNNIIITNSIVDSAYGIYATGANNISITNNKISTGGTSSAKGIYFNTNPALMNVINNTINMNGTSSMYGLYVDDADNNNFINNTINITGTSDCSGINLGTGASRNYFNNNIINVRGTADSIWGLYTLASYNNTFNNNSISTFGTATNYGIYLWRSQNNTISNNNIFANGTTSWTSNAFEIKGISQGNYIINNTILNRRGVGIHLLQETAATLPINNVFENNNLGSFNSSINDLYIANSNINYTTFINQYIGKFNITGNGSILSFVSNNNSRIDFLERVNGSNANLSGEIALGFNYVYVNSSIIGLNKSANVTFYNIPYQPQTKILRNGLECNAMTNPSCFNFTPLYGTVVFNVTSWSNYTLDLDLISPNITLISPSNDTYFNNLTQNYICNITDNYNISNMTIYIWNATANVNATTVALTGLSNTTTYTVLLPNDAVYSWNCYGVDWNNNANWSWNGNWTLILDTNTPNATLISPANATVTNQSLQNFTVNIADNLAGIANATINVYNTTGLYNQTTQTYSPGILQTLLGIPMALVDGVYNWFTNVFDFAGNSFTTSNNTLTVDTGIPQISFISNTPETGINLSQNYLPVNVSVSDSFLGTLNIYLYNSTNNLVNSTTNSNLTNPSSVVFVSYSGLSDGVYKINATVNDSAGNVNSTETRLINLDMTAPMLSIISPRNITYNNATQLLNISASDINLDKRWYNWNGTNYTYTVSLNIIFNQGNNTIRAWANDAVGNMNYTNVVFNICVPNITNSSWSNWANLTCIDAKMNQSRSLVEYDSNNCGEISNSTYTEYRHILSCPYDSDGDGFDDSEDNINGNVSDVASSGISLLNIEINGCTNWTNINESANVSFYDGSNLFIEFEYDFSQNILDLSKIFIAKSNDFLLINSSNQANLKKLFMEDSSFSNLCIKDAEIGSVSEISSGCNGANEYDFTSCLGNSSGITLNGITCYDEGSRIKVENLSHSGIKGLVADSSSVSNNGSGGNSHCISDPNFDWGCSSWSKCSDEKQTRTCKEKNNCGLTWKKPETKRTCTGETPNLSPEQPKMSSEEFEMEEEQNWFNLIPLKIKFLVGVLASIVVILVIVFVLYRLHRKKRYYKHGY